LQNNQNNPNRNQSNKYSVIAPASPDPLSTEGILCNYFESWTPETLQIAIKNNYKWDFSSFTRRIIDFVVDQYVTWAKTYRPDLYKIVSTYEGRKWLKMNVVNALQTMK